MYKLIKEYQIKDSLVFITFAVKKAGRQAVWGKILQVVENENKIFIYDVVNKRVENMNINQIDDITE